MDADLLIVGRGLAGTVLGLMATLRGWQVHSTDAGHSPTASQVAAGIVNPITGPRFVLTWQAAQLWPFLHQFYGQVQQQFGLAAFSPMPLVRPFRTVEEQNYLLGKSAETQYQAFIDTSFQASTVPELLAPHGAFAVLQAGRLDIAELCAGWLRLQQASGSAVHSQVHLADLKVEGQGIRYQGRRYRYAAVCTGPFLAEEENLQPMTHSPNKGEILLVEGQFPSRTILSGGAYLAPISSTQALLGATYANQYAHVLPTAQGQAQLLEAASHLHSGPLRVLQHHSALRPALPHRRPLVWPLPHAGSRIALLNGLGAKGASLAPWAAHALLQHWQQGAAIHQELQWQQPLFSL